MVMGGYTWLYMFIKGFGRLYMVIEGYGWLLVVIEGYPPVLSPAPKEHSSEQPESYKIQDQLGLAELPSCPPPRYAHLT